jgi:hypothetical protein
MINQGVNVPDKTIAVFTDSFEISDSTEDKNRLFSILEKPSKKREWFNPHFYKCLPLVVGNQYGFVIKNEFNFSFFWDGGETQDSIHFSFYEDIETLSNKYPRIESHFGSGIITINPPFWLRTPPGVNIMTINPPNYVIPNITVMTGVVETDHLRRNFTFNLKVQMPNIQVNIPAGTPLAAFIPIPKDYANSFKLKYADEIFSEELVNEELQANIDTLIYRAEIEPSLPDGVGKLYMRGEDIYGNKFPNR